MRDLKFIDLFCGIGGFHIGIEKACKDLGITPTCVLASDIDKKCRETYSENFLIKPEGDIKLINEIPDHDLLVGGFPCQPFSNAGNKKGKDDKRGGLFDEIILIAKKSSPKLIVLENVKHIKKISNGEVYKYIYSELENIGYYVTDVEISPYDLGIPQNRPRIIFIAIKKDMCDLTDFKCIFEKNKTMLKFKKFEFEKNTESKYKLPQDTLDVLNHWDKLIYNIKDKISPVIPGFFESSEDSEESKWKKDYIIKNNKFFKDNEKILKKWQHGLVTDKKQLQKLEWQTGRHEKKDSIFNYYIQIRQSGIRVKKTNCFPALVAMVQTPIYGKEKRLLTPRECARLQSFPDNYKFIHEDKIIYKQLGNAVNTDVIYIIIKSLLDLVKY